MTNDNKKRIIILIPCYNEEECISNVVNGINIYMQTIPSFITVEYLIINDCSTDATLEMCKKNGYNYLNLPENLGIGGCMQAGYCYAYENEYDIAVQHDGDGQHDPFYLDAVVRPILSNKADIVIGSRFIEKQGFQSSWQRRFGIRLLSNLIFFCARVKILDVTSGYRAISKKYIKRFAEQYAQDYPEPESIMDAALNKAVIIEIPVVMKARMSGESSIKPFHSLYYVVKVSLTILLYRFIVKKRVS